VLLWLSSQWLSRLSLAESSSAKPDFGFSENVAWLSLVTSFPSSEAGLSCSLGPKQEISNDYRIDTVEYTSSVVSDIKTTHCGQWDISCYINT